MLNRGRSLRLGLSLAIVAASLVVPRAEQSPSAAAVQDAMKRASTFMVDKVSTEGGYVWSYLPDLSRRWGEIEARPSMIWIQPQGTPTMGHLFLDAYHATGDEFYYRAAQRATDAVIRAQHPSGGWNYLHDFAGPKSLQEWYDTVGKNAWRLEEFQHNWGNATFDDAGTAESARLLLRMFVEKKDPAYKPALDHAIQFVLDSQYPIGAWPQRYPKAPPFEHHGLPDYTGFYTFNDDVAAENIDFLIQCYQALGETRVLEPITRAMTAFLVMQQGAPNPGWALQYTHDLKPSAARTYEPKALATHTTATNLGLLMRFYALTGETKFLARISETIDWLERIALPPGAAPTGRTHPTFIELETNRPIYVHREGSNVVNGRYYADYDPKNTLGHYSGFRRIDTADLRRQLAAATALSPAEARKRSPLTNPPDSVPLPKYVAVDMSAAEPAAQVIAALSADGKWLGPLGYISRAYAGPGSTTPAPGNFATTHVGDATDTSPYPDATTIGISTATFIRNMSVLIRALPATTTWSLDNLVNIGGFAVTPIGTPTIVQSPDGAAIEFDGASDGLIIEANPLQGLDAFTLEVEFKPARGGQEEQRFVHVEEAVSGNRALIELRMLPDQRWALDTYLRHGDIGLTLLDRARLHTADEWHVASLSFDGKTMTHYVDGQRELEGPVAFKRLGRGKTSLGVRQNLVSHFKGLLRTVRITPRALTAGELLRSKASQVTWGRGIEGQRKADRGDGTFLNPIFAGDHPDPSILKDGDDYYMTFSSFDAYPGLPIWHSRDLVNWQPVGSALTKNVGSVWAPELIRHRGRYYIYFPGVGPYRSNYVVWSDNIRGPWSEPIDLKVGRIDPGHAVGPDGKRYLFMSNGELVPLADDGLSVTGPMRRIYEGWKYPDEWVVESFSQEGPKIIKRGDYYYMVLAEGGTAGPPTGHMIIAARSRTIEGPWENAPNNPILRTTDLADRWWSKGHGTLVEGPRGQWFIVYHAYENGFHTLGRQTLLEPIEWTADGWFRVTGVDLRMPLPMPGPSVGAHGAALSDDFRTNKMGTQWAFYAGTEVDRGRFRYEDGALVLKAKGQSPADSSPLSFVAGDQAYEVEVTIESDPEAVAGLLLFYSRRLYAGLGVSATRLILHRYGTERPMERPATLGRIVHLRLRNDRHIVTIHHSSDGKTWTKFGTGMEVSGYHHNVAGEFLSLRPAIYAAGTGEVRFRNFRYRALN